MEGDFAMWGGRSVVPKAPDWSLRSSFGEVLINEHVLTEAVQSQLAHNLITNLSYSHVRGIQSKMAY